MLAVGLHLGARLRALDPDRMTWLRAGTSALLEPPRTRTVLARYVARGSYDPMRVALEREPPTPEQLALELADRIRWSEWNTKRTARGLGARWG